MNRFHRYKRFSKNSISGMSENRPVHEFTRLDAWLQRLSHVSQFGLFFITVGALYFTVIPLYQKALLEEAIAKKEIELRDANAALERTYARTRAAVIKDYVFFAGAKCSGLLDPAERAIPIENPNQKRLSYAEKLFAIDVPACLAQSTKESASLKELSPKERQVLEAKILTLSEGFLELRRNAMAEYSEAPSRVAANPKAFSIPDGFTSRMLEYLSSREPPERHQQRVQEAIVRAEQNRIGSAYSSAIREKITLLRDIDWVKP